MKKKRKKTDIKRTQAMNAIRRDLGDIDFETLFSSKKRKDINRRKKLVEEKLQFIHKRNKKNRGEVKKLNRQYRWICLLNLKRVQKVLFFYCFFQKIYIIFIYIKYKNIDYGKFRKSFTR